MLMAPPAAAQIANAPAVAPPATANALTPDQARRALETLQDDAKRAQMIDTLRAIASASPQAQPAQSAQARSPQAPSPQAAPPPDKPSAIPLMADSLGAQLLLMVSEQVRDVSSQI